ncbi:MAG: hypothetical protein KDB14_25195 [Planctomycetales bacterium]|nr:hypothetical protein [Planctomycetales bacterium]
MNELLWWFGQNSLAAVLMIPCVLLACCLFRDRPAVQHLLWLVILVKFITPPIVVWPWSVDELRSIVWAQDSEHQVGSMQRTPTIENVAAPTPPFAPTEIGSTDSAAAPMEIASAPGEATTATAEAGWARWSRLVRFAALGVWLSGAIACQIEQTRRLVQCARLIRNGEPAPEHLRKQLASAATLLRTNPPMAVVLRSIPSPFLWCVGVTRLAWPESLSSVADVERSRSIIAHELAHLRRRDHWITWLELGASILWWWNPLFWYVRRQLRETAEMSCDALAISADPECRRHYAKLLLQLSSDSRSAGVTPVLAMSSGSTRSFERRLKMVLSPNVRGDGTWKGSLTMAVLAAITWPHWSLAQSGAPGDTDPKPAAQAASAAPHENDGDAEIAAASAMQEAFRLPEHRSVQSLAFRHGSQELASLAWDSSSNRQGLRVLVRTWNLNEGKLASAVELEWQSNWSEFANNVLLSRDATRVVGMIDDTICLWDTASGKIVKRHAIPDDIKNDARYAVTLSHLVGTPNLTRIAFGRSVALGGAVPNAHAVVMDTSSGRVLQKVLMRARVHVNSLALSFDGRQLATVGTQHGATIWEVDSGKVLLEYQNTNPNRKHPDPNVDGNAADLVAGVGFSPDGKSLALCDMLGIKIVDVATRQERHVIDAPWRYHDGQPQFVFSGEGQLLSLLGTFPADGEPRTNSIWSTATGERLRTLPISGQAAAFSPDGKWFAVGKSDPKEALTVYQIRGDKPAKPAE